MRLYLHCGLKKTGSTFLQHVLSHNRELLARNGYHYPQARREADIARGRLTAGNGTVLARAIRDAALQEASDVLGALAGAAQGAGGGKMSCFRARISLRC